MTITRADFSPLSVIHLNSFEKKYGLQNHAIHRADLYDVIANAIGYEHIELNKRLQKIEKAGDEYRLQFEDGSSVKTEYVIGADGLRSQVRQQLFDDNELRDSGQVCFRGVADMELPEEYHHNAVEAWDKGRRFGFVQTSKSLVYWYLVLDSNLYQEGKELTAYTKEFHALAETIVNNTENDKIIFAPILDLKPMHIWSTGKACLIGDAAHATTPNMGQGACQAIEDAYVIMELLKKYSLEDAFAKYPEIRRKKVHDIVNTSWKIGTISHAKNPVVIGWRNFVLKYLLPESVNLKQMDKLFTLDKMDE